MPGLILLFSALAMIAYCVIYRREYTAPASMYAYSWLLICLLYNLPLFTYGFPITLKTMAVVLVCQWGFLFGASLNARPKELLAARSGTIRVDSPLLPVYVAVLLVCIAFTLQELASPSGRVLAQTFTGALEEARNQSWEAFYSQSREANPIRSLAISGAIVFAILTPAFLTARNRLLFAASVMSIIVLVLNSFMAAGRFTMAVTLIALLIANHMVRRPHKLPLSTASIVLGLAAFIFFFVIFPSLRNTNLAGRYDLFLSFVGSVRFHDVIQSLTASDSFAWLKPVIYGVSYFPTSLDKLNFFIERGLDNIEYRWGLYNTPLASQVLALLGSDLNPWHATRIEISYLMSWQGWNVNPWSSGIRDVSIDFGIFGAMAFCFLHGFVAQRIYYAAFKTRSLEIFVLAVLLSLGSFIFPFIAWMQIRIVFNTVMLMCVAIAFLYLISTRRGHTSLRRRQLRYRRPVRVQPRVQP